METVYLETSIIGYLAMRPSGLLRVAADQQTTRQWWDERRHRFELRVSRFVVEECNAGHPTAAVERMKYLADVLRLQSTDDVWRLADALLVQTPLPDKASVDAVHIAISAVHEVEYLMTWNLKHIANPALQSRIEQVCRDNGFEPPLICTPQDMMEWKNND